MPDLEVPAVGAPLSTILLLSASSQAPSGMPSTMTPPSSSGSGISSMKPKRRRSAVSSSAMERSAVFMVPMTATLGGTANGRRESGRWTSRPRLSFSSTVSSSPKMRGTSPRLISSMMRTNRSCGRAAASSHSALNTPSRRGNTSCPSRSSGR